MRHANDMRDMTIRELEQAYRADVRTLVESIVQERDRYGGELPEMVHESVNGHQWVTYQAKMVPLLSDSDPLETLGEIGEPLDPTGPMFFERIAYAALVEDVWAEIERQGVEQ